jgi:chromate transport protein ChrA
MCAGLVTFGGAYTAIPLMQTEVTVLANWMTKQQFLDGLALSSIIPAPLVIFSTFVGFVGGGTMGWGYGGELLGGTMTTIGEPFGFHLVLGCPC